MVSLIPREVLFGNPSRISPRLSPDGSRLATLAPDEGVLNLWVRTVGEEDDRPVTRDRGRGSRDYFWAGNGKQLLYRQDRDGDENWRLYAISREGGLARDLTPLDEVQALVVAVDPAFPDLVLVGLNDRDPRFHDVHRIDLGTGERTLLLANDVGSMGWVADHELRIRAAQVPDENAGFKLLTRGEDMGPWTESLSWGPEDAFTTGVLGFGPEPGIVYLVSTAGSNTGQLRALDLSGGGERVLAADPEADVAQVMIHPTRHHAQAAGFLRERLEWRVLDPDVKSDFGRLGELHPGDFRVVDRDHADRTWLVAHTQDDGPVVYHAYRRGTGEAEFLFSHRPELEGRPLARMEPVRFRARDGLTVHGYLTLPPGEEPRGLPTVLNVHGGPWHRDTWGFDPEAQWLANRGYACLQVNFRGSTGYGKDFLNAADREWGGAMQDDLTDGVRWLVERGIADPERIGIFGGSYGGYAVLAGLTFTPELYACGVDIVGPSTLFTWMKTIPPYWKPYESILHRRVGHPERDEALLRERSPLFHVDRIRAPLFIAQGANDPRVKREESLQIVEALRNAGKTVEYLEFPDEGHGFARPENRLSFYARAERFLAGHLGGRFEPEETR